MENDMEPVKELIRLEEELTRRETRCEETSDEEEGQELESYGIPDAKSDVLLAVSKALPTLRKLVAEAEKGK